MSVLLLFKMLDYLPVGLIRIVALRILTYSTYALDVWGFDEKAVEVLKRMRPVGDFFSKRFEILLNENDLPSEIRNEVM